MTVFSPPAVYLPSLHTFKCQGLSLQLVVFRMASPLSKEASPLSIVCWALKYMKHSPPLLFFLEHTVLLPELYVTFFKCCRVTMIIKKSNGKNPQLTFVICWFGPQTLSLCLFSSLSDTVGCCMAQIPQCFCYLLIWASNSFFVSLLLFVWHGDRWDAVWLKSLYFYLVRREHLLLYKYMFC